MNDVEVTAMLKEHGGGANGAAIEKVLPILRDELLRGED